MVTINDTVFTAFTNYQSAMVSALVPLIGATVGIFLAFAIANSVRFFIQKSIKGSK